MPDTIPVYSFECVNPQTPQYVSGDLVARTTEECEGIAGGTVLENNEPHAQSSSENKTNLVTRMGRVMGLSSPEAMVMGNDVGIGLSQRNFKGVIYAPQIDVEAHKENEGYDEYADIPRSAVWSRHGGAFDIVVDYPPPMNNCRQANSNHPVNMDFYLDFPQICCNERGPLMFHECGEKCWHHYLGPHLIDLEKYTGMQGDSIIHVNIHEGGVSY